MKLLDRDWVSKAPKLRRVPQFDGMRGIGVFGVMAGHSFGADTLSFSSIVDIFFVISGFLITTLLLQEHRSTGHVALKKFYARRSLRLLPLLYVVLLVNGIGAVIAKYSGALVGTPYLVKDLVGETAAAARTSTTGCTRCPAGRGWHISGHCRWRNSSTCSWV